MSIQNLQTDRLDINNRYNINFYCKQLDDIIMKIIVYDKSLPADLSEYSYRLKAFKSDQVPLIQNSNISIDNNVLTIKASNQLTTTSGIVKAELQFINKTTLEKKSTFYLNIEVVASVLYVDSDISTPTCTLLEELDHKLDQVGNIGSIVDKAIVVKGQLETDITTANTSKNSLNTTITNADNKKKELETTIINAESKKEEVETSIGNANASKNNLNITITNADNKKTELETTITNAEDKKQEVILECKVADSKIKAMQEFGDVTEVAKDINKLKLDVGNIAELPTIDKSNIVNSIKEVKTSLNDVAQNLTKHKNALVTDIGGVHGLRVESGTFTPILAGRTIAGINTYSYQQGAYYRIGNIVHFALLLATSAIDAGVSGGIEIRGLPFVLKDSSQVAFTICPNGFTLPEGYSWIGAYSTASSSAINLTLHGNDKNGTFITNNQLTQTVELRISGCYKI